MPADTSDSDSTPSSSPHLFTIVRDDPRLPKFISKNLNVSNFIKEIESKIARRGVISDKDKIAIMRSMVDLGDYHAGNTLQSDIFGDATSFDQYVKEESGEHSKLGSLSPLCKLAQSHDPGHHT